MKIFPPFDVLARIVLLPLMAWQGLQVRQTTLVLPEASGARSGICGQGAPLRLLFVGDSSAAGVGVETLDDALSGQTLKQLTPHFEVTWRLIAKTGATSKSTLAMLKADRALNTDRFDVVVIALGVNDAVRLRRVKAWIRTHEALRHYLTTHFGATRFIVPGVPPLGSFPALTPLLRWTLGAHAKRLDAALAQALRHESALEYIPFDLPLDAQNMAIDGYHPNAKGYAYCAKMTAERILRKSDTDLGDS